MLYFSGEIGGMGLLYIKEFLNKSRSTRWLKRKSSQILRVIRTWEEVGTSKSLGLTGEGIISTLIASGRFIFFKKRGKKIEFLW